MQYSLKHKNSILSLRSHEIKLYLEDKLANFNVILEKDED